MKTNIHDINDAEMRQLLNQLILNESENGLLTKKLIEMETKVLFGSTTLLVPTAASGAQVLAKLHSKLLYKAFAKWFIASTLTLTTAGSVVYLVQQQNQPETNTKALFPVIKSKTLVSDSIQTPQAEKQEQESKNPVSESERWSLEPVSMLPMRKPQVLSNIKLLPSEIVIKNNRAYIPNADTQMSFENVHVIRLTAECTNIQIVGTPIPNGRQAGNERAKVELVAKTKSEKEKNSEFEISANNENGELFINVSDKSKKSPFRNREKVDPVDLILKVTGNVNLEIMNSSGQVNISGIAGQFCKVHNDYGKVNLKEVNADTEIHIESGNVDANKLTGKAKLNCNYGNIRLAEHNGDLLVSVNSGNFNGESLNGDANIEVNYGNVNMEKTKGATLKVNTNSGNFNMTDAQFTAANITIDYGNLKLINTESNLSLQSNSGNIIIDKHKGLATIKGDYGNQDIKNQEGNLTIQSNSGKILLEAITGKLQISTDYSNVNLKGLTGDLNARLESGNFIGTGVLLHDQAQLTTNFGNINLQLDNKLSDLNCDLAAESGNVRLKKDGTELSKSNGKILLDKGKIKILARADSGNILLE